MSDTGICRLCGKEGTWVRFPLHGSDRMMLQHYCPVKAKERAEKKKAKTQKEIDQYIKKGVSECWYGWGFGSDADVILHKRYPVKNDPDDFFRINWTEEDFVQLRAKEAAIIRWQEKVFNCLKDKRRFPTRKMLNKFAEEV